MKMKLVDLCAFWIAVIMMTVSMATTIAMVAGFVMLCQYLMEKI